ncbi:hypothetical protein FRC01_000203 [Tulasnella sp. 417]|nr:hypothetical protein FRC01_000203 [Tulasnella sp. 417]
MEENKKDVYDTSQVSGAGRLGGDSPSVFLLSTKIQSKLKRLARWRIDPSLIEFPADLREFRGGFATVLQAFLTSDSTAEGPGSGFEHTTDEHGNSSERNPQSQSDTQEYEDDQQRRDEEKVGDAVEYDKDHAPEDRRKKPSDTLERQSHLQASTPTTSHESASFKHSSYENPDSDDRAVDGDHDQAKKERGAESANNNLKEQKSHHQTSISAIEVESTSPEHPVDQDQGSSNLNDAQEHGDDHNEF